MTDDPTPTRGDGGTTHVRGPWLRAWPLVVPILVFAAIRDLWAPDEPRYAQVAREAMERGGLVLHLNGELYPDKPPLVYWLVGLFGEVSGWHEFALRLPSILATLLSAVVLARLARRLFGETEARWAPLFFFATPMVFEIGGRLQLDPVLALLCLAAIETGTDERGPRPLATRRLLRAGLLAGLGALAKGPVAWLHVGCGILAIRLLGAASRSPDAVRPGRLAWAGFAALAILPVVSWAALASLEEPALFEALFFGQHLGRMVEATQHPGPPWEHLLHFPLYFLPFTPFLVVAFARAWRDVRALRVAPAARASAVDRPALGVALWFTLVFAFFSAIPVKRDLYLLPIYPAAALLCARVLADALRGRSLPRAVFRVGGGVLALSGIVVLAASATLFVAGERLRAAVSDDVDRLDTVEFLDAQAPWLLPLGLVFLWGARIALRRVARGDLAKATDALAQTVALAMLVAVVTIVPALDPFKSARELAVWLAARPETPQSIPCLGVQPEGYRFYAGVPTNKDPLALALDRDGAQFLALVWRKDWNELEVALRERLQIVRTWRVGSREILVLGARGL